MGIYQRDERWMVYYKDETGKRRDKSFGRGESGRLAAEEFDRRMNPHNQPEPDGMTFRKLAELYLTHLEASGKTRKHIETLRGLLANCFYPVLGANTLVDGMTYTENILPFIRHFQGVSPRTGKPRSLSTVNRYCDYVDAILNFGVGEELIRKNPMSKRNKSREEPWQSKLTVEDLKKIMAHAQPHVKWAMEVCFYLGTRSGESELLSLKWTDVSFERSTVTIYATKTKTSREVPIQDDFRAKLLRERECSKSEYVVSYRGRKVRSLRKSFRTACQLAGIDYPVRMYDIRHLFATTLLNNNADLAAVSKLMGHATTKMTADTYYHCMQGEKERAITLLPSLAV